MKEELKLIKVEGLTITPVVVSLTLNGDEN